MIPPILKQASGFILARKQPDYRRFLHQRIDFSESYDLPDILENHTNIAAELMQRIRPIEQYQKYQQYGAYPFYKESLDEYMKVINER